MRVVSCNIAKQRVVGAKVSAFVYGARGAAETETLLDLCGQALSVMAWWPGCCSSQALASAAIYSPPLGLLPLIISIGISIPTRLAVSRVLSSSAIFMPGLYRSSSVTYTL